jgi:A/G-specific adenine glycosylase
VSRSAAKKRINAPSAETPAVKRRLRRRLLPWYDKNKRDLPWRTTKDPYRIWISEIMLQQTRVAAAIDYYLKFLKKFPNIEALAAASLDSVLAAWSGLGYYRRARMMHQAAKQIVTEMGGVFPITEQGLQELPGIGRYTAAAIASIAFGVPSAVVDGNVERVLTRVRGRTLKTVELWNLANDLLDPRRPGDFNQAMMELGATVCVPREPSCLVCPIVDLCATRGSLESNSREIRQKREIWYSLGSRNGSVFLVQRPKDASLMAGMWELPELPANGKLHKPELTLKHSITMTDYVVNVVRQATPAAPRGRWLKRTALHERPLTGLARKILRAAEII